MNPLTLILSYYENPNMLREQYDAIRQLPPSFRGAINMIVVDDCSPKHPAQPEPMEGVALQVYRVGVDVRWNQDAARNIGAHHCETDWFVLTDMDHVVPQATWLFLLTHKWDLDHAYTFERVTAPGMTEYKPHPNSWFINKRTWAKFGGYDESFAGYYGTDGDFRNRLQKVVVEIKRLPVPIVRIPRTLVADSSTTTYLRKQPEDGQNIIRIKKERDRVKNWKPKTLSFPYKRIYP